MRLPFISFALMLCVIVFASRLSAFPDNRFGHNEHDESRYEEPAEASEYKGSKDDWDDWEDDEEFEDPFGNIMETGMVAIDKVDLCDPAPGTPCEVLAHLSFPGNKIDLDEIEIATATLYFSVNGGPEDSVLMSAPESEGGPWHAAIPGQASGASVDFYLRITDTLGNTTTGAISSPKHFVMGVPDMNNSPDLVSDDTDLLELGANYDDEYIYVTYNVQGNISGGKPIYSHHYIVKFTNPDTDWKDGFSEGLMVGKDWFFVPIMIEQNLKPAFLEKRLWTTLKPVKSDIIKIFKTGTVVMDSSVFYTDKWESGEGFLFDAQPEVRISENTFTGKIRRSALGENQSGFIRILVITIANASENMEHLLLLPIDASNFLTLYTSSYHYTVP